MYIDYRVKLWPPPHIPLVLSRQIGLRHGYKKIKPNKVSFSYMFHMYVNDHKVFSLVHQEKDYQRSSNRMYIFLL